MDKISKLSQAIRLGATFRPQCRRSYFDKDGGSCAVGAAYEVVTGKSDPLDGTVGTVLNKRFDLPDGVLSKVIFKNDHMGMTREQIADCLEEAGL